MKLDFEQRARANLFADLVAEDPCAAAEEIVWSRDRIKALHAHVKAVVDAWDTGAMALWCGDDIEILRAELDEEDA